MRLWRIMIENPADTVTRLLRRVRDGERGALDELFPLVYAELRDLAHGQRRRREGPETLGTTALVHEAYLRLADQATPDWRDRSHFYAVAATAMRHILIDYARWAHALKRGGDSVTLSLADLEAVIGAADGEVPRHQPELLILLDESLQRLEERDERQVRVIECRFFAGMSVDETAEALGISPATVKRAWSTARAWLCRDMETALGTSGGT